MAFEEMGMILIPQRLRGLLLEVMAKRQPRLMECLSHDGELTLQVQQRLDMQNSLGDELCATGLRPDDEPNERGMAIEELIDILGHA